MPIAEADRAAASAKMDPLSLVTDDIVQAYQRDGAVWIKGLLSPVWMRLIEQGIQRNINSPGPLGHTFFAGQEGEYRDDYCNFDVTPEYKRLLADSPIVDVMAKVIQSQNVWLFCDQIFVKEGGYSRRTRWHQDIPWWIADGARMGTMWIATSDLSEDETLEYVSGSFKGPVYFHGVTGMGEALPPSSGTPLPNIESEREKWQIVSHASRRGDVLIFHPACLHGGAEMRAGGKRRSLSLRFFGDDVRYIERGIAPDPEFPGVSEILRPGDLLRHPWFPQIYPRPALR